MPNAKASDVVGHGNKGASMCGVLECRKEVASFFTSKGNIKFVTYIDSRREERPQK